MTNVKLAVCALAVLAVAGCQRPLLGVYKFPDGSFAAFGLMEEQPFVTFSDGEVRGIRPGAPGAFEIGNALGRFETIEGGVVKVGANKIELSRDGHPAQVGELLDITMQDHQFRNGEVRLNGSLVLPPGDGPFPAVVLTHGSGSEHKEVSYGLAFLFASSGIAAFVYDKRFVDDKDENLWQDSFDNYAGDAVAAANMLRSNASVIPDRIGIYGHSQGGWVAPLAASKSDVFSFVIISAGNAVSPVEQHLYNGRCLNRAAGVPEWAIKEIYDFRVIKYEAGITGKLERYNAALPIAEKKPWFVRTGAALPTGRFWVENGYYDPKPALLKVKVPVLVLAGELDKYSDTQRNMTLFREIFAESSNPDVTFRVFPSANHAMMITTTGKPFESEVIDMTRFAEGYFELLVNWVKAPSRRR